MRSLIVIAGAFLSLAACAAAQQAPALKADPRAMALMDEASRTRYVWTPEVSSISGRITWNRDGQSGTATFQDDLRKPNALAFTPDGSAAVPEDVQDHVGSMIAHRVPPSPHSASRPQPPCVVVVEDDTRGPLLMMLGDPLQSTQRVKDGRLVQVNRVMEGKRFTIDVTRFIKSSDARWYPADFTVIWWDQATGKRLEKQTYTTQELDSISGQLFPKAETVVSQKEAGTSTLRISYSDVKFALSAGASRH